LLLLHEPEAHCEFTVQDWPLVSKQALLIHFCVLVAQTVPHAPQWLLSSVSFTHRPEQLVRPTWQLTAQAPPLQTVPAAQTWPQLPQFEGSTLMAAQTPEHKA